MNTLFKDFRNHILFHLNKHDVKYKIFGSVVVCLVDADRTTTDIDLMIQKDEENINNLIKALVDAGFGDESDVTQMVWNEYKEPWEREYSNFSLSHYNSDWEDFNIDVLFNLGEKDYDDLPSEEYDDNGIRMVIVPLLEIAKMKAKVQPRPRPQDLRDIKFIADHLGLDPSTGEPVQSKTDSWFSPSNLFGGKKK